ncbi:formate/nitrite transporter family protein [Brochothrix thermosphacta]|uniref:formate/nitrite transporter family protein n=1 Tax=Brochothrix thermosphacta TaxID=2756 RepID=UPI0039B0F28A
MLTPSEILEVTIEKGRGKVDTGFIQKMILGFVGGAMISLGYLAYIRVIASITDWGSFANLIGAAVFPIGLIVIVMAGGELITGNIMAVATSWFAKRVTMKELLSNWLVITFANLLGALFVAYFFGHVVGLTSSAEYLHKTVAVATAKTDATALQAFISGIGCNWFVGLAVWLAYGAKDAAGKILAIWFPVMTFVAIGFQHSVANMFVIPAAIFEGESSWLAFIQNVILVYFGNVVGGAIFVAAIYFYGLKKNK